MSILVTNLLGAEKTCFDTNILTLNNCGHKHNWKPKVFVISVANSYLIKSTGFHCVYTVSTA